MGAAFAPRIPARLSPVFTLLVFMMPGQERAVFTARGLEAGPVKRLQHHSGYFRRIAPVIETYSIRGISGLELRGERTQHKQHTFINTTDPKISVELYDLSRSSGSDPCIIISLNPDIRSPAEREVFLCAFKPQI